MCHLTYLCALPFNESGYIYGSDKLLLVLSMLTDVDIIAFDPEHHLHVKSAIQPASLFSSLFHGVSNCTINFAPKTINIGVEIVGARHSRNG